MGNTEPGFGSNVLPRFDLVDFELPEKEELKETEELRRLDAEFQGLKEEKEITPDSIEKLSSLIAQYNDLPLGTFPIKSNESYQGGLYSISLSELYGKVFEYMENRDYPAAEMFLWVVGQRLSKGYIEGFQSETPKQVESVISKVAS